MGLLAGLLAAPAIGWAQPMNHSHTTPISVGFSGGVGAQGRIVPAGGVIRIAAPTGTEGQAIVGQLLVKQGDWVEKDQLLATLRDVPLLQAQLASAQRDGDAANSALAQAQTTQARVVAEIQAQLADLDGRATLAEASAHQAAMLSQLALDQAQREEIAAKSAVDAAKLLQPAAQNVTADAVAVIQAQLALIPVKRDEYKPVAAQLQQAKDEQKRADSEMTGKIEQLQDQADLAALRTKQADAALITDPAPDDPAKLAPVQVEARAARASVDAEQKILAAVQAEQAAIVAAAQARVTSAEAAINVARTQLALSEIHAPSAGRVLSILARPGEAVGPAGLLELGDTRDMYVEAQVVVSDLPGVSVGQKALVTDGGLPDGGITGVVEEISPIVAGSTLPYVDPTVFSDQTVVVAKIRLDNPAPAANLINSQVTVTIAKAP
jgi:HlyD family secretion protein